MSYLSLNICNRRVISVCVTFISLFICSVALADGRYYNRSTTIQTSHPDWMSWMPDSTKLSLLSIPGSHDTMSHFGGDLIETQRLRLKEQLEAGIRMLDIRAVLSGNGFAIFHGCYYQDALFSDTLRISAEFLKSHPSETIIMSLSDTGYEDSCPVVGEIFTITPPTVTYEEAFELYRDKRQNGQYIWNPQTPRSDYSGAVAGPNYSGEIPELGEVRGKIVIMQGHGFERACSGGCDQPNGNGWKFPSNEGKAPGSFGTPGRGKFYGIANSKTALRIYKQFEYEIDFTWEISDQSDRAIDFLMKTSAGASDFASSSNLGGADAMYINQLNGVSMGVYPYTAAGGDDVGTDGVNEAVLRYLMTSPANPTKINRTGIMPMDFPGAALIDAIIAHNFKYRDEDKSINLLASDFEYMVNNIAYDGTEFGGDSQAEYRRDRLRLFIDHVLPDQGMNYIVAIDSLSHGGIFDSYGLNKVTDWIDTDNIFESREYRAFVFNSNSSQVYSNAELITFVDHLVDIEGLNNPLDYETLHDRLDLKFPNSKWSVFVKDGRGGFDNWAYSISPKANFYRKTIGSTDFLLVGTGKPPPPPPPLLFQVEQLSEDPYGFASGSISLSPEPNYYRGVNYFYPETKVTLTVTPNIDSEFVSWGGSSSAVNCSDALTCVVSIAADLKVQAIYKAKPYLFIDTQGKGAVSVSAPGDGCINTNSVCRRYSTGAVVELTATSIQGENWAFDRWEGDCLESSDPNTVSVTMDQDKSCEAIFERTAYQLSVSSLGGTVVSDPGGDIDCGTNCTGVYPVSEGTKIEILTAHVDPDAVFVRWYGDADCFDEDENDGEPKRISVTVGNTDVRCSAMAVDPDREFAFTIEKTGAGVGKVTAAVTPLVDSSDIDCELAACSQKYLVNSVVKLTATAARGSRFAGWNGDSDCVDGQVTISSNITCSARFTAALLLIDGSNSFGDLENAFFSMLANTPVGGDYDYWSIQSKRLEPIAEDLADYSRVIWFTANSTSSPKAGPSPIAEAALGEYLDSGGCLLLSSPEYFEQRGLTVFAETYLGISESTNNVGNGSTHTNLVGEGLNSRFDIPGPFRLSSDEGMNLSLSDSLVSTTGPGNNVLLRYTDGGDAAVSRDNGTYRSAFFGFPFLGLNSGNDRNGVMHAFLNYCGAKELDDVFEHNDSFDEASHKKGMVSLASLKIMPGNDDYFRWVSEWDLDTEVRISFKHTSGDLSLEVYDSNHTLIGSALSTDDNEKVVISNVVSGEIYFVRVFGVDNAATGYVLNILNAVPFEEVDVSSLVFIQASVEAPFMTVEPDFDQDGIVDSLDSDDDNDGLPDSFEQANNLDPLDVNDAALDKDSDGLSNYDEFRIGTNINLSDTDGDGIGDNIDNNPLVFEIPSPTLYSGQLTVLPDINDDGVAEIGILKVVSEAPQVQLDVLNGKDKSLLKTIIWADSFDDSSLALHVIPDMNDNGFDEVGLFGIQDASNNAGKPQMFVRDIQTGNKVSVYNWPANWKSVSALILKDISGDGIAEIGIQGRFKDGNRPQLVVKNGANGGSQGTYAYPNLFTAPMFYQHSDVDGDGFEEIATFGVIRRNNKIQVKITNGINASNKMKAYNFPDKWDDVSWHRLDDSNADGVDDWGLFGISKEDGRIQLIVKDGIDPKGALAIYAWPSEIQTPTFYLVPDINGDGVDEVAVAGQRSNNNRYQFQIKDGQDRNVLLANHNLNLNLTDVSYHVLPDLNGDGLVEIGFLGLNPAGEYELVIRQGDTTQGEFRTDNLGVDWSSAPSITSLGDTDNDGIDNLLIYGQNANEQLIMQAF